MLKRVVLSLLVFVMFMAVGLGIASKKLLWSDELFTQEGVIDRLDYHGIIVKMDIGEGNISPLFYTGQKLICQLTGYRLPVDWKGEFCVYEPLGQIILRILPVACMAAAVALIFLYFYSRGSLALAAGVVCAMASQFSFWVFMPEARPYALWFLLGVLQALLLLEVIMAGGNPRRRVWVLTAGVNLLMSLTIVLSAIPIFVMAALIAVKYWRRSYRVLSWAAGIPLGICVLYYHLSKKNYAPLPQDLTGIAGIAGDGLKRVFAGASWGDNILVNVPPYWLIFIAVGTAVWLFQRRVRKLEADPLPDELVSGMTSVFAMALVAAFLLVSSFLSWQTKELGGVAQRYFIFLTPLTVVTAAVLVRYFWAAAKDDAGLRAICLISFGGTILLSGLWSMVQVMGWGPFWSL